MLHADMITPVPELLHRQAVAHGGKVAYRDAQDAVTYAQLEARTARLAGHLADLGVAPGDTIAMLLPNAVAWVETSFAITRAGALSVPISYESTEPEIAYRLADAACKAIVTTAERAALVAKLRASVPCLRIAILTDRGAAADGGLPGRDPGAHPRRPGEPPGPEEGRLPDQGRPGQGAQEVRPEEGPEGTSVLEALTGAHVFTAHPSGRHRGTGGTFSWAGSSERTASGA